MLPEAFVGGVLYLFGFTASVYHLSVMAGLRLFAVLMPLQYKFMRNRTIAYILGCIWFLSIIAATSPGNVLFITVIAGSYCYQLVEHTTA